MHTFNLEIFTLNNPIELRDEGTIIYPSEARDSQIISATSDIYEPDFTVQELSEEFSSFSRKIFPPGFGS